MKNMYKLAIVAALGLVSLTSAQAASNNGDLLIGFTTQAGNDTIYDLGQASALTDGETWNLASLLTGVNLSTVNWGVIGNSTATGNNRTVWTTTDVSLSPVPVSNSTQGNKINAAQQSIENNFATLAAGQSLSIAASDANSWNSQTLNPSLTTQYQNVYENPNSVGTVSEAFWSTKPTGTPTQLGTFSLDSSSTVTYNVSAVPEPATYGLFAGAGMLILGLRRQFARKA